MGVFGRLFGSEKVIDSGMKALDSLVFTDEEKSKAKIELLKSYEAFKIGQRYIALVVTIPYMTAWIATFFATFFDVDTKEQQALLSGDIGTAFTLIVAFYFAGGVVNGFIKHGKP